MRGNSLLNDYDGPIPFGCLYTLLKWPINKIYKHLSSTGKWVSSVNENLLVNLFSIICPSPKMVTWWIKISVEVLLIISDQSFLMSVTVIVQ